MDRCCSVSLFSRRVAARVFIAYSAADGMPWFSASVTVSGFMAYGGFVKVQASMNSWSSSMFSDSCLSSSSECSLWFFTQGNVCSMFSIRVFNRVSGVCSMLFTVAAGVFGCK